MDSVGPASVNGNVVTKVSLNGCHYYLYPSVLLVLARQSFAAILAMIPPPPAHAS